MCRTLEEGVGLVAQGKARAERGSRNSGKADENNIAPSKRVLEGVHDTAHKIPIPFRHSLRECIFLFRLNPGLRPSRFARGLTLGYLLALSSRVRHCSAFYSQGCGYGLTLGYPLEPISWVLLSTLFSKLWRYSTMTRDLYSLEAYQYELPEELIAQHPLEPRDRSRLMIVDRQKGEISEIPFHELRDFLGPGDRLIFNDTKVIPARLVGRRPSGGRAEIFLTTPEADGTWCALVKPGKKLPIGAEVHFDETFRCEIVEVLDDGRRRVRFFPEGRFEELLDRHGQMPLPPYIRGGEAQPSDLERYQTIFAAAPGAVAAPTAGLHFTHELLNDLTQKQIEQVHLTLHVGLGTFQPVHAKDIRQHSMHTERFIITGQTAKSLNTPQSGLQEICVGTTTCRALESAANEKGAITPGIYDTDIFIYPGYTFKRVNALLTNFHLPGSTLLMLVSALGGYDLIREAYAKAIADRFRFYSYGDAMLII